MMKVTSEIDALCFSEPTHFSEGRGEPGEQQLRQTGGTGAWTGQVRIWVPDGFTINSKGSCPCFRPPKGIRSLKTMFLLGVITKKKCAHVWDVGRNDLPQWRQERTLRTFSTLWILDSFSFVEAKPHSQTHWFSRKLGEVGEGSR